MQLRTAAAILMLVVVALLFVNRVLQSEWLWLVSVTTMVVALIIYFIPRFRH